jgi:hypothetical protein
MTMAEKLTSENISQLQELAKQARCIDPADYGSNRQVDAENAFYEAARPAFRSRLFSA